MFIVTWLFDKLGYMPKINVSATLNTPIEIKSLSEDFKPRPKRPAVKKTTVRKK